MDEVTQRVIGWMRSHCRQIPSETEIPADSPLLDQGWLDSLQTMHLVSHLEDYYKVKLPIEDMIPENFETPAKISAMILRLLPKS